MEYSRAMLLSVSVILLVTSLTQFPAASSVIIRNRWLKPPWKKLFHRTVNPQASSNYTQVSPVILVPGDGGSQLQARLNKKSVVHYFCAQKSSGWFDLWLNIELLLPYVLDCWVDNMKLRYNNVTKTTENADGVEIRVVGFGNSSSVEYLDSSRVGLSRYFIDIAELLIAHGYKRDISIRGAPYDFRKAPNELDDYFVDVKKLVEDTYEMNNQTAVTFIAHSMGNLMTLHLLHLQTPEWRAKYIKAFITLGAPWAGAVKALKAIASGDNLNVALISAFRVRAEQRSNPSIAFFFPNTEFWDLNQVFVQTAERNYTLSNLESFFLDMGFRDGWEMYKRTANLVSLKSPGIPTYCLYGIGVDTPTKLIYGPGQFPDTTPKIVFGDGDGTVNRRSLEICSLWQSANPDMVQLLPFQGVDHMSVLLDKKVLSAISKIIFNLKEIR